MWGTGDLGCLREPLVPLSLPLPTTYHREYPGTHKNMGPSYHMPTSEYRGLLHVLNWNFGLLGKAQSHRGRKNVLRLEGGWERLKLGAAGTS